MPRYVEVLLIVAWVAVLAACGGGGDGAEAPPSPGLLAGDPASRASATLADIEPVPAEAQDADGGALLTRINVVLRADASVADVNAAGQRVGATAITFSTRGSIVLTFAVPRQGSAAALAALAERLDGQPGIAFASPGREAEPLELPVSGGVTASTSDLDHLLATRFPAAWNVRRAAESGCSGRRVTVIVPDFFFGTPANFVEQLEGSFSFDRLIPEPQAGQTPQPHGFRVAATLAAKFDALPSTGANPAPTCLQLRLVNGKGLTLFELVDRTAAAVRRESGPVIISSSIGYNLFICGPNGNDSCTAADIVPAAPSIRQNLRDHFVQGILWADFAMQPGVVDRMLLVQAAGNDADTPLGRIYAGLRSARLGSPFAIATTLGELDVVATAPALWAPVAPAEVTLDPAVPDLSLDAATLAALRAVRDLLVTNPVTNRNLLLIGASDNQPRLADLHAATLSNDGAALFAVGQGVTTLDLGVVQGTSYSAPQVAGLASYLWLLEPSLASQPPAATIALLRATTQGNALLGNVVDAYAAVLSLDEPAAVTPATARVRLAILDADADGDGDFDLADLQAFHGAYVNAGAVLEPTAQDYGRFDLNGDGFTGGSRATRMDLDPTGSTRFGAPLLTQLQLSFGNAMLSIDETAVTDAQALCFYALSALYTGSDLEARDALLSDLCPTVAVVVERSIWVGQVTSSGGTTPLGAQLDFLSDGSLIGKAGIFSSTFDVSGQVVGNSLSFGVVSIREDINSVITGTFTGSIDSARTQMSGGYSIGGESGSWTLKRCTGLDQPVVGCPG